MCAERAEDEEEDEEEDTEEDEEDEDEDIDTNAGGTETGGVEGVRAGGARRRRFALASDIVWRRLALAAPTQYA